MYKLSKRTLVILSVFAVFAFFSCGCGQKMALTPKTKSIDLSKKSIVLMTTKLANTNVPGHQPTLGYVYVGPCEKGKGKKYNFAADAPYIVKKKQYNEHLVSMALPPGDYALTNMYGFRRVPLLLAASCVVPLEKKFTLEPDEILYIGKVDATIRKKEDGEKAAGGPFPLIDQAVAGFSTGTFDIEVLDNYNEDIQLFKSQYPILQGREIEKAIME